MTDGSRIEDASCNHEINRLVFHRYYDIVRDVRQNKGSILKASVEYIKKLKSDQHKKRLLEEKVRIQESQNRKLLLKLQVISFTFRERLFSTPFSARRTAGAAGRPSC